MYDLEIYAKYREREIKENLKRRRYEKFYSNSPSRLILIAGSVLTFVGDFLSKLGQKLLDESNGTEMHHSPGSIR